MSLAFTLREMKSHWLPWTKWQEMTQLLAGPWGYGAYWEWTVYRHPKRNRHLQEPTMAVRAMVVEVEMWRSRQIMGLFWRWRPRICCQVGVEGKQREMRDDYGTGLLDAAALRRSSETEMSWEGGQSLRPVTPQLFVLLPWLSCPGLWSSPGTSLPELWLLKGRTACALCHLGAGVTIRAWTIEPCLWKK